VQRDAQQGRRHAVEQLAESGDVAGAEALEQRLVLVGHATDAKSRRLPLRAHRRFIAVRGSQQRGSVLACGSARVRTVRGKTVRPPA
jgi:hypothetical protein